MRLRGAWGWIAVPALLACGGCGFKGPLYLPEHNPTVVTHPAPPAPATGQAPPSAAKPKSKSEASSTPPPP